MARSKATPYPAQLAQHLSALDGEHLTFSVSTLYDEFQHGAMSKPKTNASGIHKALIRAWPEGTVISYVDDHGNVLREDEHFQPGSAAIANPQIFGTPGTPSPKDGFRPVTYAEYTQVKGSHPDDVEVAAGPADDVEPDAEPDEGDGTDVAALLDQAREWRPGEGVPAWVSDEFLREWVSLPTSFEALRLSIDRIPKPYRSQMHALGIPRKGRFGSTSAAAKGMVRLLRRDPKLYDVIAGAALHAYLGRGEFGMDGDDVIRFRDNPIDVYLENRHPAQQLLLVGFALGISEDILREIADDFQPLSEQDKREAETKAVLEQRAGELAALRAELKDARNKLKAAQRENTSLKERLERQTLQQKNGVDEQLAQERAISEQAEQRIAELEAELQTAQEDAAAAADLEAQLEASELVVQDLQLQIEEAGQERDLRERAEEEIQSLSRRVHELTQQLSDRSQPEQVLPVSDGPSLIEALRGSIAKAAEHAAARIATGQLLDSDAQLLQFASQFAQLAASMPAPDKPKIAPAPRIVPVDALPGSSPEIAPALADTIDVIETVESSKETIDETVEIAPEVMVDAEPAHEPEPARRRRRRRQTMFTVRPLGGAEEVGGSAVLVSTQSGANVLLDAGQRVAGEYGPVRSVNPFHYVINQIERLDGIVVSHAHIDHVGSLPLLHRHHSSVQDAPVPVLMSEPTRSLSEVMLSDSAKIQQSRADMYAEIADSEFGPTSMEAAYGYEVARQCIDPEHTVLAEPGKGYVIEGTPLIARLLPVPHVLGSCAIHLTDTETDATLLYTGDLGPVTDPQRTLPNPGIASLEPADVVIMESTYGELRPEEKEGRLREGDGRSRATEVLATVATETLERGGHLLLPAFSLGRTQELLMMLAEHRGHDIPDGKIYVAGMGERITRIYEEYDRPTAPWLNPCDFPSFTSVKRWMNGASSFEDVVGEVLSTEPAYIIASPAMVSSGWSRAFMEAMISDPRHGIVFTGYLPQHAGGITDIVSVRKGSMLRLPGETQQVKCDWRRVSLSAHAPSRDLEAIAAALCRPKQHVNLGLMHGTSEAQAQLHGRLSAQLHGQATVHSLRNHELWLPRI